MKAHFSMLTSVLFFIMCSLYVQADSDSLRIIHSFYRNGEDAGLFTTSKNGDTVALVYTANINKAKGETDTVHLQVRTWNSLAATAISTSDFFHVQLSEATPVYKVGTMVGTPSLIYASSRDTLKVANIFNGTTLRTIGFPDDIWKVYMSPDFSHSMVTTKNDRFYIVNMLNGQFVLQDSVWRSYKAIISDKINYGTYNVHFKVACESNSWSSDNSLVMIRVDRLSDTLVTDVTRYYEQYWRPYDLVQRKFLADSIDRQDFGRWLPNAKRFITYTAQSLYISKLDLVKKQLATGKYIYDFAWADGSPILTIVDPGQSISFWDMDTQTKVGGFSPGSLAGYCFNDKSNLIAYITESDSVIKVVNTITQQGIYSIKCPFKHAITFADRQSFRFVDGDKALIIRDENENYQILDLPASAVVATVKEGDVFNTSSDGVALFILQKQMSRYDLFTNTKISTFPKDELLEKVRNIDLSPDAKSLVALDSRVRLFNSRTGAELRSREYSHSDKVKWTFKDSTILLFRSDSLGEYISGLDASTLDSLYTIRTDGLHYMGMSPNGADLLVAVRDTLVVHSISSGKERVRFVVPYTITAAAESYDGSQVIVGGLNGNIQYLNISNGSKVFEGLSSNFAIRSVVPGSSGRFLSYISDRANKVIRVPEDTEVQNLSTPTRESFFVNHDSLCICIYDEAIVEFYTSNGHPSKIETSARPYFRPQHNYYAIGNPDTRDSFALFDYGSRKADRALRNLPVNSPIVWSHNSASLALVDVFNNIVIWTPANLKTGDIASSVQNEGDLQPDVELLPQPASDYLLIRGLNDARIQSVSLVNLLGQRQDAHLTGTNRCDLRSFSSGMYHVKILLEDGSIRYSNIVIQH